MNSKALEVWLDERWYEALSQQLENETVEEKLDNYLDELISQLPEHVREKISREILAEDQQREQEIRASRRYSAFRIVENGGTKYFRMDRSVGMLEIAGYVRLRLRQQSGPRPLEESLRGREEIPAEEFERMLTSCMEGGGQITDAYDVDLDRLELSAVRPSLGWVSYRLKDASTAVWHADRCGSYDWNVRKARFMEKLAGREIASAGHLSAENFSFADEITADDGRLNFYLENSFDVDRVFGTRTAKRDDWLNVYANYDMASGQVCDMLEVDLHRADGREGAMEYRLNAVEKAALLQKMDAYCQQQTGQSLADYSAQHLTEDMVPPAGPVM